MTSGGAEPDSFRPGAPARGTLSAGGQRQNRAGRPARTPGNTRWPGAQRWPVPPVTSPTGPAPGTRRPRDPAVPAHAMRPGSPGPDPSTGLPPRPGRHQPVALAPAHALPRRIGGGKRHRARAARRRTCARPAHSVSAPPSRTNDSSTPAVASKNARPIPTDRLEAVRRRIRHQRLADGGPAVAAALVAVPGTAAPKVFHPACPVLSCHTSLGAHGT